MTLESPFTTGRKEKEEQFMRLKPDTETIFIPLTGLKNTVSAHIHSFWDEKVFFPCYKGVDGKPCPGCAAENPPKEQFFMAVMRDSKQTQIFQFGPSIQTQIASIERATKKSCAGKILNVSREGSGINTRYTVMPTGDKLTEKEMAEPFAVIPLLNYLAYEDIASKMEEEGIDLPVSFFEGLSGEDESETEDWG